MVQQEKKLGFWGKSFLKKEADSLPQISNCLKMNENPNRLQFKFLSLKELAHDPENFGQQQRQKINHHRQTIKSYNLSLYGDKIRRDALISL